MYFTKRVFIKTLIYNTAPVVMQVEDSLRLAAVLCVSLSDFEQVWWPKKTAIDVTAGIEEWRWL